MAPPGGVGRAVGVDDEAESVVALAEILGNIAAWRFDEPADGVFVIPAFGLVRGVGGIVDVVVHFGAEVKVFVVPGDVIARRQVLVD